MNRAPAAGPDSLTTEEDAAGRVDVLVNDSDPDGDELTVTGETDGEHGTVDCVSDGSCTYTPARDFNGADSFTYTVSDGRGGTATGTVDVTVDPVNDAPACADRTLTTDEDTPGAVSPSCTDVDGEALTYEIATQGTKGTASVTAGQLRYEPKPDLNGADAFTYTGSDGTASSAPATVSVAIDAVNDPPAAATDEKTVAEDASLSFPAGDLTANDSPGPNDESSQTLTVTGVSAASETHGTVGLSDGTIVYTPASDYTGEASFAYTVRDDGTPAKTASGTVRVTVSAVNDAPVAVDDTERAAEGGIVVLDVTANDSLGPGEDGQTLAVDAIVAPPSYGAASVIATGANAGKIRYEPPARYQGPDWLEYRVCDSAGACDRADVRLQVVRVAANAETSPMPNSGDAADDAAIWRHPSDPALSTIIGTDKGGVSGTGGLAVYDLEGRQLQYLEDGKMNNVDLRDGFPLGNTSVTLVAASDRTRGAIALYTLDAATRTLAPAPGGAIDIDFEPYGLCLYRSGERFYVFVTDRDRAGYVEQWELAGSPAGTVTGTRVRHFDVGELTEGCVADDERGRLYLAEEKVGIWSYSAGPNGGTDRVPVDSVSEAGPLVGDVEGLSLAYLEGGRGYLVAASQGNGSYTVYRREGDNAFVRSFRVKDGDGIDGTSGIDGVDVTTAALGPSFPNGLFVSHDGTNVGADGAAENQNFKLVPLELALGGGTVDVPPRPTSCPRPYSSTSPWNTATGDTHDAPLVDPRVFDKPLSSDPTQYTYPVYEVTSEMPLRPVTLDPNGWYSNVTSETTITSLQGLVVDLPLPAEAEAAAGADAQIILVNRETGDEWGAFRLGRNATTGAWEASNAYHYNTGWSGVPPRGSRSDDRFWSRGAGVPYLAGLVRPCEIARGRIEHALAFAYDYPTGEFVYPATKSDGKSIEPYDLPEGTRLQLDPSASAVEIQSWGCTGACLTIAKALQEYGMYVIDASDRPKVMLEYEGTARWNGAVEEETARPIPLSRLRVLPPPPRP